jgi:ribosomal subunit interface protein
MKPWPQPLAAAAGGGERGGDMQRELKLTWNHVAPSEALEALVRRHAARLERFYDRITGCAVTLEARSRHHRQSGSHYRVRVELDVPGGRLVVGRNPDEGTAHEDPYAAVSAAFREARRRLQDHAQRADRRVKEHAQRPTAHVARLFPRDGYGFLVTPEGREVYFHARSVLDGAFDRLSVGSAVAFAEELGEEGPQASTVTLLGAHRGAVARPAAERGA